MLVKLVEIFQEGSYNNEGSIKPKYSLRETYINPNHVVCIREEPSMLFELEGTSILKELDLRQEFTRMHIDRGQSGLDITVVGSLKVIKEKLSCEVKRVLKG